MAKIPGPVSEHGNLKVEVWCYTGVNARGALAVWASFITAIPIILWILFFAGGLSLLLRALRAVLLRLIPGLSENLWQFWINFFSNWPVWASTFFFFGMLVVTLLALLFWYRRFYCRCPTGTEGVCFAYYYYKAFGVWVPYFVRPHSQRSIELRNCPP